MENFDKVAGVSHETSCLKCPTLIFGRSCLVLTQACGLYAHP